MPKERTAESPTPAPASAAVSPSTPWGSGAHTAAPRAHEAASTPAPSFQFRAGAASRTPFEYSRGSGGAAADGESVAGSRGGGRSPVANPAPEPFRFSGGETHSAAGGAPADEAPGPFQFRAAEGGATNAAPRSPSRSPLRPGSKGRLRRAGGSGGKVRAGSSPRRVLGDRNTVPEGNGSAMFGGGSPTLAELRHAAERRRDQATAAAVAAAEGVAADDGPEPMSLDGSTPADQFEGLRAQMMGVGLNDATEAEAAARASAAATKAAAALHVADAALEDDGRLSALTEEELFELHSCLRAALRRSRLANELPDTQVTAATARVTCEMERRLEASQRERGQRAATPTRTRPEVASADAAPAVSAPQPIASPVAMAPGAIAAAAARAAEKPSAGSHAGMRAMWRAVKATADGHFYAAAYAEAASAYTKARGMAEESARKAAAVGTPNAVATATDLAVLHANFAAAVMMLGRSREGLLACEEALALDAGYRRARQRAAACCLRLGRAREAEARYARCEAECRAAADAAGLDTSRRGRDSARAARAMAASAMSALCNAGASTDAAGPACAEACVSKIEAAVRAALQDLNVALTDAPECCALRLSRSRALLAVGRFAEALTEASHGIDELSSRPPAQRAPWEARELAWKLRVRACARLGMGDMDSALKTLAEAITAWDGATYDESADGDGEGTAEVMCGDLYETERAELAGAAAMLQTLVAINQKRLDGNAKFAAKDHEAAEKAYAAALQVDCAAEGGTAARFVMRLRAACFCNRAAAHHALHRRALAAADCGRAIALDSWYAKAWSRRAAVRAELGDGNGEMSDLGVLRALYRRIGVPRAEAAAAEERLDASRRTAPLRASDPYAWLGLRRDANAADIKKAYRRLALAMHPDKAAAALGRSGAVPETAREAAREDANALFSAVSAAHDTLSDPAKKAEHDANAARATGFGGGFARSQSFPARGGGARGGFSGFSGGTGFGGYGAAFNRQRSAGSSGRYGGGAGSSSSSSYASRRRNFDGYRHSYEHAGFNY